ncbi:phosphotransferase [Nakamurella sp. YIM 132087]|uniref:Phosphotransferase n=1 Tax=Nakamurella alba TaxID=2665158 RepID=A0A7K1FEK6_9ACTN|nr:phosphotransferase [Nakamurella alba]
MTHWFAARGHQFDASGARRFTGGLANVNQLVTFDGRPAVLRHPPVGPRQVGANDMAREWKVLSGLGAVYPLAPLGLAYCDDESVLGVPFLLVEFRDGIAIGADMPPMGAVDAPKRLTGALVGVMAELHDVDPAAAGVADLGRPENFLSRQVTSWHKRAGAVWPQDIPAGIDRMSAALAAKVPVDDEVCLLHMDLKFDNMLVNPDTCDAQAVIDWDMATRGTPLFDLAVLLAYWIEPSDPADVQALERVPSLRDGFGSRTDLAEQYLARTGRSGDNLVWLVALARYRLAVLWMQLFRLWQQGSVIGDGYADFERLALALLDLAEHNYLKGTL